MLIKSISSIGKCTLKTNHFISFNFSCGKKKMSTLENVIDGWNDVRSRIKEVVKKQNQSDQVYNHFKLVHFKTENL